jgi:hypothetical protein
MSKGPLVVKSMLMNHRTPLHNAEAVSKVFKVIHRFWSICCMFFYLIIIFHLCYIYFLTAFFFCALGEGSY